MVDEATRYLTVKETAERLRVVPQTVYRWCRAGRLAAVKIGKDWRIPAHQLGRRAEPAGLMPLDALLARLIGGSEHLLGLAGDKLALARMEAAFFDAAAATDGRLVHTRWGEDSAAVRLRLRPAIRSVPGGEHALHLLDFQEVYEEQEVEGPVRLLLAEVERAAADGTPCYIYGSPYPYFGYHFGRLTGYEREIADRLGGQAALVLCGYALSDLLSLYEGRALSLLTELMDCHSGMIWFDGQRALLCRPAGRMT